jgi:hypothetical protein
MSVASDEFVVSNQLPLVQVLILAHREELFIVAGTWVVAGELLGGVDVEAVEQVGVADGLQGLCVDGDVADGQVDLLLRHLTVSKQHSRQLILAYAALTVSHTLEGLLQLTPVLGHQLGDLVQHLLLLFLIQQLEVVNDAPQVSEEVFGVELVILSEPALAEAGLKELVGVVGGEEEGLGLEHADKVVVVEAVEGRTLDIRPQLMEGVTRVLHSVSQDLPDLLQDGGALLGVHWLSGLALGLLLEREFVEAFGGLGTVIEVRGVGVILPHELIGLVLGEHKLEGLVLAVAQSILAVIQPILAPAISAGFQLILRLCQFSSCLLQLLLQLPVFLHSLLLLPLLGFVFV